MADDLEELRRKKLEALKQQAERQQEAEQQQAAAAAQLDALVKKYLDEAARARLTNVKLAKPALYAKAAQAVLYLAQSGRLDGPLTDAELKELLTRLKEEKEFTIRRK